MGLDVGRAEVTTAVVWKTGGSFGEIVLNRPGFVELTMFGPVIAGGEVQIGLLLRVVLVGPCVWEVVVVAVPPCEGDVWVGSCVWEVVVVVVPSCGGDVWVEPCVWEVVVPPCGGDVLVLSHATGTPSHHTVSGLTVIRLYEPGRPPVGQLPVASQTLVRLVSALL